MRYATQQLLGTIFTAPKTERLQDQKGRYTIDVPLPEGGSLGCRFHVVSRSVPTVLLFHSPEESVSDYEQYGARYNQLGINLFVATYRGYGWSNSTQDSSPILDDSALIQQFVWNMLQETSMQMSLFLMGRRFGTAVVIDLCHRNSTPISGIIVESGFTETGPYCMKLYGLRAQESDRTDDIFANTTKIADITSPTLFLHGGADTIIPPDEAEKLQSYSGARTKKFFLVPKADHFSLLEKGADTYFAAIKAFVDEVTGASSWRARRKQFKQA